MGLQGTRKTRERLALVDELLVFWKARRRGWCRGWTLTLCWQLEDADQVLEELEEALIVTGELSGAPAQLLAHARAQTSGRARR